jgi:tetratricopeptide (TPR) repeat protein
VHRCSALIVTAVLASVLGAEAPAQGVTATDRSIASGRDTIIEGDVYQGATKAEVEEVIRRTLGDPALVGLVEAAARGASVEANAKIDQLSEQLELRREALTGMFAILGRERVPPERLAQTLAEIATRHKALLERVRLLDASDPRVAQFRDQAADAIENAAYDRADQLLAAAETIEVEAMQRLRETLDQRALNVAAIRAERGELARTRLDYLGAAEHFRAAAEMLPPGYQREQAAYLYRQAVSLYDQGNEFGDNDALKRSIAVWSDVLALLSRADLPLDWARTQNNLGAALATLGERESGTARLEEAVAAYRAALEEMTRERVPLDWAQTQNNLGNALWTLGERTDDVTVLRAAQTAVGNAFQLVVVEAGYTQYEAYFRERLESLEQAIADVKAGLAEAR